MSLIDKNLMSRDHAQFDDVDAINKSIANVRSRIVGEIQTGSGEVWSDTIADSQCYLQAHIRRAIMFLDGGHEALLAGHTLVAVTCARSIFESAAVIHDFCKRIKALFNGDDPIAAFRFVAERSFAMRFDVSQINSDQFNFTAVNILTLMEALDKASPYSRRSYEQLSEIAHPNAPGALLFFQQDRSDGAARFGNGLEQKDCYDLFVAAASMFSLIADDLLVAEIAYLAALEKVLGNKISDYERRKALGLLPQTHKSTKS